MPKPADTSRVDLQHFAGPCALLPASSGGCIKVEGKVLGPGWWLLVTATLMALLQLQLARLKPRGG